MHSSNQDLQGAVTPALWELLSKTSEPTCEPTMGDEEHDDDHDRGRKLKAHREEEEDQNTGASKSRARSMSKKRNLTLRPPRGPTEYEIEAREWIEEIKRKHNLKYGYTKGAPFLRKDGEAR